MVEKIQAVMIFEILGKPAEFVKESLDKIADNLSKEKGVKVKDRKIQEPKPVENSDLYSSFAELEIEADDLSKLMIIMFNYMPAHIEIHSPGEIRLKNFDLSAVCNELMIKLHGYDGVAKTLMFERTNLINQIQQLSGKVSSILPETIKKKKAVKKKKI